MQKKLNSFQMRIMVPELPVKNSKYHFTVEPQHTITNPNPTNRLVSWLWFHFLCIRTDITTIAFHFLALPGTLPRGAIIINKQNTEKN